MNHAVEFGAEVRRRRQALTMSLRELARRVDRSPSHVSEIELGTRTPSDELLEHLRRELGPDLQCVCPRCGGPL